MACLQARVSSSSLRRARCFKVFSQGPIGPKGAGARRASPTRKECPDEIQDVDVSESRKELHAQLCTLSCLLQTFRRESDNCRPTGFDPGIDMLSGLSAGKEAGLVSSELLRCNGMVP